MLFVYIQTSYNFGLINNKTVVPYSRVTFGTKFGLLICEYGISIVNLRQFGPLLCFVELIKGIC